MPDQNIVAIFTPSYRDGAGPIFNIKFIRKKKSLVSEKKAKKLLT